MANGNRSSSIVGSATLLTVVIVVAVLYFARMVLIPLALAVLLAFLLAPLVIRLRHLGLGRVPSAIIVVLFSFLIIGIIGSVMASQLTDLAHKLPEYQQNVRKKLESVRASGGGIVQRVSRAVRDISDELTPAPGAGTQNGSSGERPVPVEIRRMPFSPIEVIQKILGSVVSILLMGTVVIVFAMFMLIQREDLRDRLIRLAGERRINVTTQLLDDAAHRVSRYLLAQLVVNVAYGFLAGIGLYFIGVPDPLLWGMLAALLRYIPYLGIWIAATMPAAVAFAVEPGWMKVPTVFGLYFGIDLLMYNLVEPLLYGSSTGVSPIAILVAAVFWTWLWGPVGLLLATPLTVCVVVIGRYVPKLQFLGVMLSDEEVLTPQMRFYQRMLAMDLEEATEVAEEFLRTNSLGELYDRVIIPALSLAEEERHRGRLDEARQKFLFENTRLLVQDLGERAEELMAGSNGSKARNWNKVNGRPKKQTPAVETTVLCIPARDEADEISGLMLAQLMNKRGIGARNLRVDRLATGHSKELNRDKAKVACVLAVPPFGYMHARYLCRHLRTEFQDLKLVTGVLTEGDLEELKQRQPAIPADNLATSLKQLLEEVAALVPAAPIPSQESALRSP